MLESEDPRRELREEKWHEEEWHSTVYLNMGAKCRGEEKRCGQGGADSVPCHTMGQGGTETLHGRGAVTRFRGARLHTRAPTGLGVPCHTIGHDGTCRIGSTSNRAELLFMSVRWLAPAVKGMS